LGPNATEPPEYLNVLKYRLLTIYSRASTSDIKKVISTFCMPRKVSFSNCNCYNTFRYTPNYSLEITKSDSKQYVRKLGRVQTVEWTTGMEYWTGLLEWLKLIVRYMLYCIEVYISKFLVLCLSFSYTIHT